MGYNRIMFPGDELGIRTRPIQMHRFKYPLECSGNMKVKLVLLSFK